MITHNVCSRLKEVHAARYPGSSSQINEKLQRGTGLPALIKCTAAGQATRYERGKLLTCFLPDLFWAGVTGSSALGVVEPTDLLLPVCTTGAGLAGCLEAEAPGDAFPLPCEQACNISP